MSTVYLLIFFMFLHYFLIELKKYPLSYLAAIIFTATILEIFMIWFDNIFKIVSLIIINIWIVLLVIWINDELNNRRRLSLWWVFNNWVGLFSLAVAISYSFMFVAKYKEFNLTCDILYKNVNMFIDVVSSPLNLSIREVNSAKNKLDYFYTTKVKDIIGLGDTWTNILSWDINSILSGSWVSSGMNLSWLSASWTENLNNNSTVFGRIMNLRNDLMKTMTERKETDKWVCNFMIDRIKDNYWKPYFTFSVILSLSFLLWSFIRLMMFLLGIINYIIFKIMELLKIYKVQKVVEEVEEVF